MREIHVLIRGYLLGIRDTQQKGWKFFSPIASLNESPRAVTSSIGMLVIIFREIWILVF